jgi:hypothetical protein
VLPRKWGWVTWDDLKRIPDLATRFYPIGYLDLSPYRVVASGQGQLIESMSSPAMKGKVGMLIDQVKLLIIGYDDSILFLPSLLAPM